MNHGPFASVLRHIRSIAGAQYAAAEDDARLLERFITARDEQAFEALLQRHGPMVLGVCRRLLANPCDVEDAFQATFLVLIRKARSLRRRELVGKWLYGVAYRTALKARSLTTRRQAMEKQVPAVASIDPAEEWISRDLRTVLDSELSRLPIKYRVPVILCYLEGMTFEEAARQLGWPAGTVSGRLSRAKEMLRKRLARRGLSLSIAALVAALTSQSASAVPPALARSASQAALLYAIGQAAAGTVSTSISLLLEGMVQAMFWSKVKKIAVMALVLAALVAGAGVLTYPTLVARQPQENKKEEKKAEPAKPGEKGEDRLTKLLKERVEAAQNEVNAHTERFKAGAEHGEMLIQASIRLLTAQRELGDKKAEQVAALEAHLKRVKKVEETTQGQSDAGRILISILFQVRYYRIEAEIWLERAKAKK